MKNFIINALQVAGVLVLAALVFFAYEEEKLRRENELQKAEMREQQYALRSKILSLCRSAITNRVERDGMRVLDFSLVRVYLDPIPTDTGFKFPYNVDVGSRTIQFTCYTNREGTALLRLIAN